MKYASFTVVLLLIVIFAIVVKEQTGCGKQRGVAPKADTVTVIVHDTVRIKEVVNTQPKLTGTKAKPNVIKDTVNAVCQHHDSSYFYADTARVKHGYIAINDTVEGNRITGRSVVPVLNIPIEHEIKYITTQAPPRRQVFAGGGLMVNQQLNMMVPKAGIMYKNRRGFVTQFGFGYDFSGKQPVFELQSLWLIKF